mmetsp:Transcript_85679/g.255382  ORF Transcript_85679/g.255382 Transcript_85679/m.255382 type:complete len:216 (+) Transcript_85679:65-712(+)|eukprot:CAMPEP_0175370004 /NCGR_PEP_ID=MMETSP0095-20121207/20985_1 /TAXON_ID=311494 /ORGANISM="Alexandrium monilatum, Strain CCMP3105" /LENGTH=215 /DNA_ID=CAMNT_0016668141 /DNA_START=43 /DNA_END=687 /DNA_ORIENTATION=-
MSAFVALPTSVLPRPVLGLQPAGRLGGAWASTGSAELGVDRVAGASSRGSWLAAAAAAAACVLARRGGRPQQRGGVSQCHAAGEGQAGAPKPKAKAKAKARPKAKAKARPKPPPEPLADQAVTGIFAPLVIAGHAVVGEPFVTKARGKGIGLHSKAITAFCETFAIPNKKRQGFIKTAKSVGHDLGFLIPGGHFGDGLLGNQAMQWWQDAGIDKW